MELMKRSFELVKNFLSKIILWIEPNFILDFLRNSITHEITGLGLNLESTEILEDFKPEAAPFIEAIIEVKNCSDNNFDIEEHIDLHYFDVTSADLKKILTNFPKLDDQVSLVGCNLILSEPIHLPDVEYKLKKIDLSGTKISSLNGEEEGIKNLMSIFDSPLAESVHELSRWKCNISKIEMEKHLTPAHLQKIWLEEDE